MKKLKCGADITLDGMLRINNKIDKNNFSVMDTLVVCTEGQHRQFIWKWDKYKYAETIPLTCPLFDKKKSEREVFLNSLLRQEREMTFENLNPEINNIGLRFKEFDKFLFDPEIRILILIGAVGIGKTHIAKAILHQAVFIAGDEIKTKFIEAELLYYYFRNLDGYDLEIRKTAEKVFENLKNSHISVIDDLGDEKQTEKKIFNTHFKSFLDIRKGKLIITTNLAFGVAGKDEGNKKTILGKYGNKIWDRLRENSKIIFLTGKSQRGVK